MLYADTSFLVSLYGRDSGSGIAQQLANRLHQPFALTPLHRLEARNALRLAIFRNDITAPECAAVLSAMQADETSGVLVPSPVAWAEVFDLAEALSANHTPAVGARAFDILHVASAGVLGLNDFLTLDTRQAALARQAGMTVRPP